MLIKCLCRNSAKTLSRHRCSISEGHIPEVDVVAQGPPNLWSDCCCADYADWWIDDALLDARTDENSHVMDENSRENSHVIPFSHQLDESSTAWSTPAPWDSRTTHTMMVARPSLRKTPSGWWVSSEHLHRDSPYGLWYIAIMPDIYIYI